MQTLTCLAEFSGLFGLLVRATHKGCFILMYETYNYLEQDKMLNESGVRVNEDSPPHS